MIILDTNVLSALMRQTPEPNVVDWLDRQPRMSIWTTSVTILEIKFGLQILPAGKKKARLMQSFAALLDEIGQRVAPFDTSAAQHSGDLMALRHKKGQPVELRDTIIAGIVLYHHAILATRNTTHFADLPVPVVNPWISGASKFE